MSQNQCEKCYQNIVGTIYQITVNGKEYKSYCQPCYEKIPIGIRPYDHRGSGNCQVCKKQAGCGKKGCKDNCLDSISRVCGNCWGEEWRKCLICRQEVYLDENRECETCRKTKPKPDKSNL